MSVAAVAASVTSTALTPAAVAVALPGLLAKAPAWATPAAFAAAYWTNYLAVSVPGRLDGRVAAGEDKRPRWDNLFAPSGWAFSIWAFIFAGEALLTGAGFLPAGSPLAAAIRAATPAFVSAQLTQSLWCATFRPRFEGKLLWVPALNLLATAAALLVAHDRMTAVVRAAAAGSGLTSPGVLLALAGRAPVAVHAGWVTAATLVNANSWVRATFPVPAQAALATASAYAALVVGTVASLRSGDPLVAATGAWALAAVTDNLGKRRVEGVDADAQDALRLTTGGICRALLAAAAAAAATPALGAAAKSLF